MIRIVVIGGSDAGISAALRAKEICSDAQVSVLVADRFPNYSICGLPFYLSGEVTDWKDLAHRTVPDIEKEGIELLLEHRVQLLDVERKEVVAVDSSGKTVRLPYDRLVIGTGAASVRPPIQDLTLPGVFFLRWMDDAIEVHRWLTDRQPKSVLIVGGGYIGMEMADALAHRGLAATVVEHGSSVLRTVDPDLGELVRAELAQSGVEVVTDVRVEDVRRDGEKVLVAGDRDFRKTVEMVIVATGVAPETSLARAAGISTGVKGAIRVDRRMQTNVPDVFAAGDCSETYHRVLGRNAYLPLGSTAHKQGRVAGENAAGGGAEFGGTLGTQVVKIFGMVVARTGLRTEEARAAGHDPVSADCETWDHKRYYPGATPMRIRMTGDRQTGRLLGAQVLGRHGAEVSKRVDVLAAALFHEMKIADLVDLDLSYSPPLSSPWDPVQQGAQIWLRESRRP